MSWIRHHSYEVAGRACWRANFEDPFVPSCPVYSPLNIWTGLDMGKMTEHTCMLVMLAPSGCESQRCLDHQQGTQAHWGVPSLPCRVGMQRCKSLGGHVTSPDDPET